MSMIIITLDISSKHIAVGIPILNHMITLICACRYIASWMLLIIVGSSCVVACCYLTYMPIKQHYVEPG